MEHKEKITAKEGRVSHLPEKAPVDASGKEVLLSLKNVDITFGKGDNAVRAVKNASFDIYKGETFSLVGESGSGKTTTLYACLNHINRPDKKIITVEDPVEYELSGINQVMVKADIGMTFAAALRAMLRQAPNIIMIGEIRDMETASIAINASLTGHLVFSTLHTNDAPSAVARLADIGIKRFLIASSVRAIMAQRLVRKLCDRCKVDGTLTEKQAHTLNIDMSRLAQGQIKAPHGCDFCRGGGFKGRMGLFEIFEIDDEVRRMINENLTSPQLRQRARELGMRTLREDGVRKVLAGLTSPEEVLNVTMGDAN